MNALAIILFCVFVVIGVTLLVVAIVGTMLGWW